LGREPVADKVEFAENEFRIALLLEANCCMAVAEALQCVFDVLVLESVPVKPRL
jgi:hypothetical protein